MSRSYWILLFSGIFLSSFGGILLKAGSLQMRFGAGWQDVVLQLIKNWQILLGLVFYFIPAMIWIYMLQKIDISFLQPLFSLVYVVTPILAIFFFKEPVSLGRWLGIGIMLVGLYLVARS